MRVALVGAEIEENLSVRYLAASLETEGHDVSIVPFAEPGDEEAALEAILGLDVALVGISMVFQMRALEFMGLAERLRERGWRGHVTCGGHFATFNHETILRRCAAMDSVIRHEGERTMADLARALEQGLELDGIDGLTFRRSGLSWVEGSDGADGDTHATRPRSLLLVEGGDGVDGGEGAGGAGCSNGDELVVTPRRRPVDDLDTLPFPVRDPLPPLHLGIPVASLVGSRGCYGSCSFCCIHAWHRESGGKRVRWRSAPDVVREMEGLYHARGVRIFIFHDDNFFSGQKERDLERIHEMGMLMRKAGMDQASLVVKARPNDVHRETFMRLREIGLARVYLGIENASEHGLQALNRRVTPAENERALSLLEDIGVFVCFNLLIFEPDMEPQDVLENLAFMERHASVPHNFCRAECYTASGLQKRLEEQGRLHGDYLGSDYVISDPRMETLFRIFTITCYERNFASYSIANEGMGLGYEMHLFRRYHPRACSAELEARVASLLREINLSGVERLREAFDFVMVRPLDPDTVRAFAADLGARGLAIDYRLSQRLRALKVEIEGAAARDRELTRQREAATAVDSREGEGPGLMSALKAAAVVPLVTLSLLTSSCGSVDPAPSPTVAPASPSKPPPPPDPLPPPIIRSPSPSATYAPPDPVPPPTVPHQPRQMPPPDPVPPPNKPTPSTHRINVRNPLVHPGVPPGTSPPYVVDPAPPSWNTHRRRVLCDPAPHWPSTPLPRVIDAGDRPGSSSPSAQGKASPHPSPPPLPPPDPVPPPILPPPVDPPPRPASPSPSGSPHPRPHAELPLPRTLQGNVAHGGEGPDGVRMRLDYVYLGEAGAAAALEGKDDCPSWIAPDGVTVQWRASAGKIRIEEDGSIVWRRPHPASPGFIVCTCNAPDGAVWVGGWHEL